MPYGPGGWTPDPIVQPATPGHPGLGRRIVDAVGGGITGLAEDSPEEKLRKQLLMDQARAAGGFADVGERGFDRLGSEASTERDYLRQLAAGQNSVSQLQLAQANQQTVAQQRSLAAGAAPQNAAMAALQASQNVQRASSGLAGAQAQAGLQERQMAHDQLRQAILGQRQQELQAALGSRQNANAGYGAVPAEKSDLEKYGPAALAAGKILFSDRRLKKNVRRADREADDAIKSLRAYTYAYKDERHGKGKQTGILAQDLERAGLKHTVIETPVGKAVHGAALTTANTALIARLGQRVAKLEGGRTKLEGGRK